MSQRFNPAPGWPAPPVGWRPPPGWRPDPAWPSPPPGWKLWIDDPELEEPALSAAAAPLRRRRIPADVRRAIARNSILAVAASVIGAVGFQSMTKERTEFASLVVGFVGALFYFWMLRVPAALLELYITRTRSRRWIYWPHAIAAAIVVFSIAGDNANLYRGDSFVNLLTLQAATFALLEYLFCALVFLLVVAAVVLIKHRVAVRRWIDADGGGWEPATVHRTNRRHKAPSRDAAVFALSITTGIAGVAQGFDIHNAGRTILAFAAGAAGLYFLYRLPGLPSDAKETRLSATPRHSSNVGDQARDGRFGRGQAIIGDAEVPTVSSGARVGNRTLASPVAQGYDASVNEDR